MRSQLFRGVIYALIVISISLTLLQGYFPLFTMLWLTTTTGAIVAFFISQKFIKSKSFLYLMVYFVFIVLNLLTGDFYFGNAGNVVLEISSLLLVCLMYYGLIRYEDIKAQGFVFFSFIIVLLITTIGSFVADAVAPGIIRKAFGANVTGQDKEILTQFYKFGMSNYTLPHAIPILIPGVVFGIKCHSNLSIFIRIILWIALASLLLLAYLSSATTALIFSLLSLAISFSLKQGNERANIARVLILLLVASPFLLSKDVQLSVLKTASTLAEDNVYFQRKIDYFQESITNKNADVLDSRDYLYEMSYNGLLSNPLLGTNAEIGGHSSMLDRLATLGIIGMTPFILFLLFQYKATKKRIAKNDVSFYILGFLMGMLMCCLKGMWNWEMHFSMFVFLPISIIYIRNLSFENK